MARSLFEPAPEPLSSRVWRKMKHLNIGLPSSHTPAERPVVMAPDDLARQAESLDARGRQLLLQAELASRPLRRR